jgi:uncharacterized membrane protein
MRISTESSKRMEALSDGIFAIVATLLVLEIRLPELQENSTNRELVHSLLKISPSFIAFVFSFLNVGIFWVNHDQIGKTLKYFDNTLTYLNILFLMFISLVPFTTAFVCEYPMNVVPITVYGVVFFFTAVVAVAMYYHIAFRSKLMHDNISKKSRKKIWKRVIMGPVLFLVAIISGFIHVYIPAIIYIITPLLFLILPKIEFEEN